MEGFRIVSLKLIGHPILGNNEFNLYDGEDSDSGSPYFTIIIGPNGTGKSELLRCLLLIFRDFYQKFIDNETQVVLYKPLQFFYELHYKLKGNDYLYTNNVNGSFISLTGQKKNRYPAAVLYDLNYKIISFSKRKYYDLFPLQIVAQSIMMTDKYFVPRNEKDKLGFAPYHYLGIRNRPQQSSTGYYVRRTVDLILKAHKREFFLAGVKKLLKYIDTANSFIIQYRTQSTSTFFTGHLTVAELDIYFNKVENLYVSKQAPYKLGHYKRLKKGGAVLTQVIEFANTLVKNELLGKIDRSVSKQLNFDLLNSEEMKFLEENRYSIDWLRKIGLLSEPKIKFSDKDVELQNASSGEFHLFTTMIGLMASTRKNTLVVIDEPEISLHPNWQMQYLNFIRELFADTDRNTAHILIATHSHFLVSDLTGDSGNIIGLRKRDGNISSVEIKRDTFGWSAEQVLLDVFEVSTSRNYVVAERIGEILDFISKEDSTEVGIRQKFYELGLDKLAGLSDEDPLKMVYDTIVKEYVQ